MKTNIFLIILLFLTSCTNKIEVTLANRIKRLTYDTSGLTMSNNAVVLYQNVAMTTLSNPVAENNDVLTKYSVSDLPPGLAFNSSNGSISGTPITIGIYNTVVTGIKSNSLNVKYVYSVTIYVNNVQAPSALVYPTPNAESINVLGTVPVTSVSGTGITFSGTGLPTGYSVNNTTGTISGTYTGNGGSFSATITATNINGSTNAIVIFNIPCAATYTNVGGTCVVANQSRACLTQPSHSTGGTESSTDGGVSWGACASFTCDATYTNVGGTCSLTNQSRVCLTQPANSTGGTESTTNGGSTWGLCSGFSCSAGFNISADGLTCDAIIIPKITKFSIGVDNSCGINSLNKLYCWGWNGNGVNGDGTQTDSSIPIAVDPTGLLSGKTVSKVSVGDTHACAVTSDGAGYCWGNNTNGQLGNNTLTTSYIPVAVDMTGVLSGKSFSDISAGSYFTCGLTTDGGVYCWGWNGYGQLGDNSLTQRKVPVAVSTAGVLSGKTGLQIVTGLDSACLIASDYKAYCWGRNDAGQLGDGTTTQSKVPVAVSTAGVLSGKTIRHITNKIGRTACVIANDNLGYCWGENGDGQLGTGLWVNSSVPTAIDTTGSLLGLKLKGIMTGSAHICANTSNNIVVCMGRGANGQMGNGLATYSEYPTETTLTGSLSGKTINGIIAGWYNSCAMTTENKFYCWGWNNSAHFGISGDYNQYNTPVLAVPGFVFQ